MNILAIERGNITEIENLIELGINVNTTEALTYRNLKKKCSINMII